MATLEPTVGSIPSFEFDETFHIPEMDFDGLISF
jgi:hypothetical protein